MKLPAVVLPLISFDCLLGMSWIKAVGVNLDIEKDALDIMEKNSFTPHCPYLNWKISPKKLFCSQMEFRPYQVDNQRQYKHSPLIKGGTEELFTLI